MIMKIQSYYWGAPENVIFQDVHVHIIWAPEDVIFQEMHAHIIGGPLDDVIVQDTHSHVVYMLLDVLIKSRHVSFRKDANIYCETVQLWVLSIFIYY